MPWHVASLCVCVRARVCSGGAQGVVGAAHSRQQQGTRCCPEHGAGRGPSQAQAGMAVFFGAGAVRGPATAQAGRCRYRGLLSAGWVFAASNPRQGSARQGSSFRAMRWRCPRCTPSASPYPSASLMPPAPPLLPQYLHKRAARDDVEVRSVLVVSNNTAPLPKPQHVACGVAGAGTHTCHVRAQWCVPMGEGCSERHD